MIEFLLKSTGCLAILLVFYHLVLEREKMHQFNRFYLLGSALFSFIAPLFTITTQIPIEVVEVPTEYIEPVVFNQQIITETPINYWNIIIGISIVISSVLSVRFVLNLHKIYKKIASNSTIKLENAVLVLVDDAISPHTFWNHIFINKEEYHSNKIETELFTHELTHVTQKHTFDVLLIEVLKIVFWFNPLFYFLKKLMQLNHEFIADEKVINSCKNISEYQYLLLNKAAWNNDYYLASNLNYSLTKKRLVMMTTKTSKVNNWLKKLAVLPLLTGSIYVFAERVETYEKVNNNEFLDTVIEKKEISDMQTSNTSEILTDINKKLKDANSLKMSITNNNVSENFIASVERDDNYVFLKCYNCERWAGLEIPLNKEYTITDWGFSTDKHVEIGKYAFTIKATKKEVILKGIKNISWNSITPPLNNKKHFFNQQGSLEYQKDNLEKAIKQYTKLEAPTLFIDQKTNNYYLNNRLINIENIRSEFLKETKGEKSNLEIFTTGKVLMSLIKTIREKLSKEYLDEIILTNSKSYIYNDGTSLKTSKIGYDSRKNKDSIPTLKRIVNRKNETFTYTTKGGKTITKKFSELTDEEKKLMPPPPAPVVLKEKKLSTKLFQELKNSKKYAIWIDGKVVDNNALNSYKNTDFYNYSGSFVHKNARSKRFPQEYQYQLNTKKHILKIKKQLPPPPPPAKDFNKKPKTGFINAKNQTLYYVKNEKGTTYYNRWGQEVTKEGEIINPEQTASDKVIPGQNITKVYKDDKVVSEFKRSNLPPPPPKAIFPEVKKGEESNIPPPQSKEKTKNKWVVGNEVHVVEDVNTETGTVYKRRDLVSKPSSINNTEFVELDENFKKNYFIEDKKVSKKEFFKHLENNKEYHYGSAYTDKEKSALNMYISKSENKIIELMQKGY
ncbi:M56 family metallopeptidase [Tenacibaculum crassostreae]|uniref:M56 family metallopeptidase n=1 Tax=Tenacibaculum crassostreae TaxID=502683 RepID=UPI00389369A2